VGLSGRRWLLESGWRGERSEVLIAKEATDEINTVGCAEVVVPATCGSGSEELSTERGKAEHVSHSGKRDMLSVFDSRENVLALGVVDGA
jgi:hypothetical protein